MATGEPPTSERVTWGDIVRVLDTAPPDVPREFGTVCGMSTIETDDMALARGFPVGTPYVTVEVGDGRSFEVPESCVELVERDA